MEYYAYLHSALVYEESLNVEVVDVLPNIDMFSRLKQQKYICKTWLYSLFLSLTLILLKTSGSVLALQMEGQEYQISNSTSNPISKIKSKQNLTHSSHTSNLSYKFKQKHHTYIKSKLHLINDTPYLAFFLLYKPGGKQPKRYANIRPCTKIILRSRYTNLWRVNYNGQPNLLFLEKFYNNNKNVFELKTSQIDQTKTQKSSCQYAEYKSTDIQFINDTEDIKDVNSTINYKDVTTAIQRDIAFLENRNLKSDQLLIKIGELTDGLNNALIALKSKWGLLNLYDEQIIELEKIVENYPQKPDIRNKLQKLITCISKLLNNSMINKSKWSELRSDLILYYNLYTKVNDIKVSLNSSNSPPTFAKSSLGRPSSKISEDLEICLNNRAISYQIALKNKKCNLLVRLDK